MTRAQRQHWEYQQRRAERLAQVYGMGHERVREIRERAAGHLQKLAGRRTALC